MYFDCPTLDLSDKKTKKKQNTDNKDYFSMFMWISVFFVSFLDFSAFLLLFIPEILFNDSIHLLKINAKMSYFY